MRKFIKPQRNQLLMLQTVDLNSIALYNIGNNNHINLMDFIEAIEENIGKKAIINLLPMQPGDIPATWADVTDLIQDFDYRPNTPFKVGVKYFLKWYRAFYNT